LLTAESLLLVARDARFAAHGVAADLLRWKVAMSAEIISGWRKRKIGGVRALIFDLDGTLIDSKLDLALSVNAARAHLSLEPLPHEKIYGYVGRGAPMLIRQALGREAGEDDVARALEFFLAYYRQHLLDNTLAYPGVREALDALDGRPMAVLSNKPAGPSQRILEGLGLAQHFQFIYGGNSFAQKKPDPEGLLAILRDFGVAPREAMVVGDSEYDVLTARHAGAWACGVSYGLGSHQLAHHPPDLLLDNLSELPACLDGA
jgi:phosphoglycolate phosphatase